MTEYDIEGLKEELEQFKSEKEKIRRLVGQIGGKKTAKRDKIINVLFIIAIIALFAIDTLRHLTGQQISLPAFFSIELGLLLVSVKIIWMIHKQAKVEHFQFWILNSIEYRLNDISKQIRNIQKDREKTKECTEKRD